MRWENRTSVTEFFLLGLSESPVLRGIFFFLFSLTYVVTLQGNTLLFLLACLDTRLHTPMYFFLANLSFLDICTSTTTVPRLLVDLLQPGQGISVPNCFLQLFWVTALNTTELMLLTAMAYDRYVAVWCPLRYAAIMNRDICVNLAAGSWVGGCLHSLIHALLAARLPFCGPNQVNQFFCNAPQLLELSCADTSPNEAALLLTGVALSSCFLVILVSYAHILAAVQKRRAAGEGRGKAFSTCASHLAVVVMFYGSAAATCLAGKGGTGSVFYTAVTPMLNPVIYSLRNQEVRVAWRKLTARKQRVT
ncbi:olfactory receptor 5V1-like [Rhinatrema bivittatum]|uniref:olfactory receptor 5V1-like n=1 Tax=Rhinatrema bivittatum TaxID=194408 RepID=UPI00112E0B0A|nr:olfactory receptor 5V1-like [Rhinatrema bivittatum]